MRIPILTTLTAGCAAALMSTAVVAATPAGAATLDEDVFITCAEVRFAPESVLTRREARAAGRQFARLDDRTPRRKLAPALKDASTAKERRRAGRDAHEWCDEEVDAYRTADVTLHAPPVMELVDVDVATITGTTAPGAAVTARVSAALGGRSVTATADASGAFTLVVPDVAMGESTVSIATAAPLHYAPVPASLRLVRTESEAAYKASTREIPPDELVKDPAGLRGTRIYSRGEVFQYDSRTGLTAMLVAVRVVNAGRFELWTDPVLLRLETAAQGNGIDQDDIVEFWGEVEGAYSYTTAIGGSNTVPQIKAKYVALIEKQ